MKESTDYDKYLIWRHARHCVVIVNTLLSLALLHYGATLLYKIYNFIF